MAIASPEMFQVCRFCLCQEKENLIPLKIIIGSSITIQDVEYCSGVLLTSDDYEAMAICVDCTIKVKQLVDFRKSCISKDGLFRQLYALVNSRSAPVGSIENSSKRVSNSFNWEEENHKDDNTDSMEMEEGVEVVSNQCETERKSSYTQQHTETKRDLDGKVVDKEQHPSSSTLNEAAFKEDEFFHSANYIEPGQSSLSDSYSDSSIDWSDEYRKTLERPIKVRNLTNPPTEQAVVDIGVSLPPDCKPVKKKKIKKKSLCYVCGALLNDLTLHMEIHLQNAKHSCPHCPVHMVNPTNLLRHIQSVHEKMIRKSCGICGKGFTNNNSYISHMFVHHGIGNTHKCKLCPKVFRHASGLRTHIKKCHSSAKKYECTTCIAFFSTKQDLTLHIGTHSAEQPYACTKCPKRFKRPYGLRVHEQTHSGILFECSTCHKTYRYKALLNMHIKNKHPKESVANAEEENRDDP